MQIYLQDLANNLRNLKMDTFKRWNNIFKWILF